MNQSKTKVWPRVILMVLAASFQSGSPAEAQDTRQYACYVRATGVVYRIDPTGADDRVRRRCIRKHVRFSWEPRGPEGPVGPEGMQGGLGPVGADGAMGPPGPEGPEGPIGPQGPVGPQGELGPTGPEGPKGGDGPRGEMVSGPTGPRGFTGPTGPQGPRGPGGPVGPDGPAGLPGPAGPEGPEGSQGTAPGPIGPAGPEGPRGNRGGEGPLGPTGGLLIPRVILQDTPSTESDGWLGVEAMRTASSPSCPTGTKVVSGTTSVSIGLGGQVGIRSWAPDPGGNRWTVTYVNIGSIPTQLTISIKARCLTPTS